MLEQFTEGLFGLLQVLPAPGSAEDLSIAAGATDSEAFIFLSDYYNNNAHDLLTLFYMTPESEGVEPVPDAIQANGLHKGHLFMGVPSRSSKTLVHVIAASAFSMFTVSVDGVNLQVVEVDSTAVVPLTVPSFTINVAQRVSFVVDWSELVLPANATPGAGVYFRASAMTDMYALDPTGYVPPYESSALVNPPAPMDPDYTAVFQFAPLSSGNKQPDYAADGSAGAAPVAPPIPAPGASSPYRGLDTSGGGLDTNLLDAVPAVPLQMPPGTHQLYVEVYFWVDETTGVNVGHLNGISHVHNMEGGMMPTLFDKTVYGTPQGSASAENPAYFTHSAKKPLTNEPSGAPLPPNPIAYSDEAHYLLPPGAVVVMLINNTDGGEHPFHFHGHTVWVLATSEHLAELPARAAAYSIARRDTVSVPGMGWAKVACESLSTSGALCVTTAGARAPPTHPLAVTPPAPSQSWPRTRESGLCTVRLYSLPHNAPHPLRPTHCCTLLPPQPSPPSTLPPRPHRVARRDGAHDRVPRGPRLARRHARAGVAPAQLQPTAAGRARVGQPGHEPLGHWREWLVRRLRRLLHGRDGLAALHLL